eukprot:gene11526-8210_t
MLGAEFRGPAGTEASFALQEVLDAFPTPDDDIVKDELDLYRRVAECLVTDPAAVRIAETIRAYAQRAVNDHVFMVVEAPSGSGKSQLPFVLQAMGITTIHVVLEAEKTTVQTIYRTVQGPSQCLLAALAFDMRKWSAATGNDEEALSRHRLLDSEERAVVRVITYLLGNPEAIVGQGKFTMYALRRYVVAQRKAGSTLPVFFLDEVMALNHVELRYLCNVFRAVGLLVVLMGTGSTAAAANLVEFGNHPHSRGCESSEWCHVVTRLPRSNESSLSALGWTSDYQDTLTARWPALVAAVNACHSTSNPLFIRVVIETLLAASSSASGHDRRSSSSSESSSFADDFDGLLLTAMGRLYDAKPSLTTREGLVVQLCLHSNWYRPREVASVGEDPLLSVPHVDPTVLVTHHFAMPTRENYSLQLTASGELRLVDGTRWMNEPALFARCAEDPWLYLILGGGKYPQMEPWRLSAGRKVQTLTANTALTTVRSLSLAPGSVRVENSRAVSRSSGDDTLELLGLLATIVASRCNGVRGATWWDFVRHLTTHLVCDLSTPLCDMQWRWHSSTLSVSMETLVGRWVVPFLGPLNSSWPAVFQTLPEVRFGEVERAAPNKDRLEFKVKGSSEDSLSFTGEFKNYRDGVDQEIMSGILTRVPTDTRFHLVGVSKLQKKYSLSRANLGDSYATTNVVKVVVHREDRTLSLAQAWPAMDLVPWDTCTRLVLYVEEGRLNPSTAPVQDRSVGPLPKRTKIV